MSSSVKNSRILDVLYEAFWAPDFAIGLVTGALGGAFAFYVGISRGRAFTLLLAMTALGAAVVALSVTVMAIVFAFVQGDYYTLLEERTTGGFVGSLRTFKIVAVVGALSIGASFVGALTWNSLPTWAQAVIFGGSVGLTSWALAGSVQLLFLLSWHASKRADLERIRQKAHELLDS